jgi:DNA repair exonuclease SbcCD nuclease subunit
MQVAIITDTHIGSRNDSRNFSVFFRRFYEEVFFPYLREHGITRILHGGDLFERRKYINFQSLGDSREYFFDPLRDYDVDLIVGNHDTYFKNTNVLNSPDLLLNDYPRFKSHWQPTTIDLDGFELALLPWVCTSNFEESMEFIRNTSASHLLGHLEIAGFEMHLGQINDHGFDPKIFDKFEQVWSGHFHHKSSRGNIMYLGSPYEQTWSDYNDPKGFHVFDTETRELTFVENPYRMFHKIYYDDVQNDPEQLIAGNFEEYTNTYVRVVIKEKSNPFAFERFIDKLSASNPIDITYTDDTLDLNIGDDELMEDIEDTAAIIVSSIEQSANPRHQVALKKMLLELYNEAVSLSRL